jgi:hypothetical protein
VSDERRDDLNFAGKGDDPCNPLLVVGPGYTVSEVERDPPGSTIIESIGLSFGPWPDPSHLTLTVNGVESEWVRKPVGMPRKVCLCGSTRFKRQFIEANYRETMAGCIVLSVGWFSHADAEVYAPTEDEKRALDELHLRKIDLSDEILVIDVRANVCSSCGKLCKVQVDSIVRSECCGVKATLDCYIGESTRREIDYAIRHGKPVRYWSHEQA